MPCLGNDTLLDLAGDRSPDRLARFEAHLDECEDCRRLVGELADLSWMRVSRHHDPEPVAPAPAPATLATGRVIDRYIIIEILGAGGMGVVYAAYDPRLDRKIALKVLRPDADGHDRGARLLQEAKTLARLRHPNVVAVHDAGTFEDRVFVAMELVEGVTLREWLRVPRDWREIVRVFLQAARGLEAAHAAGIVHRDFKPDNVLIDLAGRAQVADFGLARSQADRASAAIVGTPAYMSPEQRRGEQVTAKSDQFSFCVALHDAFGDRRPARIAAAVARGMHEDPARRFASMHELARALRRRSPIVPAVVATAAAACVALAAFGATRTAHSQPPPCGDAKAKLAHVWDGSMREMLRLRFVATGRPDANATLGQIASRLDGYTKSWIAEHTDACEATRVRGEQSEQLLDQRMACLDTRLGELETRIHILHEVTPDNLDTLPHLFDALVEPSACRSRSVLHRLVAPPPRGLVSTFDAGTLATTFGEGWSVSTDTIMRGRSRGELHVIDGGDGTPKAMSITGTVEQAQSPIAWAGAMFYPGAGHMAPADLSAFRYVAFSARGDGGNYEVLLFSQSKGDLPAFQRFAAGPAWKQYRFALADFDGVNPGDIKGLLFASNRAGPFSLQIDQVRFE